MNRKNSKLCPECGNLITDDAVYCAHCGKAVDCHAITTTNKSRKSTVPDALVPPPQINTIEDMENYLQKLSEHANESAEAALKAQLQVIHYVQSPKLYDSSFDMLFKCIKNALKYADSPKMQEQVREQATIMIQNYVFFMNAKLQYEVAVNRKEYEDLMEDACKMLAESAADVATLAVPGGAAAKMTMKSAVAKASINMLTKKDSKGDNLLTKFHRWWTKDTRTKEKQSEFIQTIDTLITKLYKQKDIIGKSDLIAGIVNRYASDITEYLYKDKLETAQRCFDYAQDNALDREKISFWVILSVNILVLLLRWIFKGIGAGISFVSAKIADAEYVAADTTHWALQQCGYAAALFAFISIIILIQYLINRNKAKAALTFAQKEYDDAYQNYLNIAAAFEE